MSTKTPRLEQMEELVSRVRDATRFVPLERLAVSPQCGFASSVLGNRLALDDQRAKLELVGEVARRLRG